MVHRKKLLQDASYHLVQILNSYLHCVKKDFTSKSKYTYHNKQLNYETANNIIFKLDKWFYKIKTMDKFQFYSIIPFFELWSNYTDQIVEITLMLFHQLPCILLKLVVAVHCNEELAAHYKTCLTSSNKTYICFEVDST